MMADLCGSSVHTNKVLLERVIALTKAEAPVVQFYNEQPFCLGFSSQRVSNRYIVLTAVLFKRPPP